MRMNNSSLRDEIRAVRINNPDTPVRTLARMIVTEAHCMASDLETDDAIHCWRIGKPTFASVYNRIRRIDGTI